MNWFDYLKKTSLGQIVVDAKDFIKLKRALKQAEKDMVVSGVPLVRYYGIGDNIGNGNACIKSKCLVGDFELFESSPCSYYVKRCAHFAPEGNEQKCPNDLCVMYKDNNVYCDNRQKYNALKAAKDSFWADKFANVK